MSRGYMVFGWSNAANRYGPADEFLGTTETIDHHDQEFSRDPETSEVTFGFTLVERPVRTVENLLQGKTRMMKVLTSFSEKGPDYGLPIVAYLEIKKETSNG